MMDENDYENLEINHDDEAGSTVDNSATQVSRNRRRQRLLNQRARWQRDNDTIEISASSEDEINISLSERRLMKKQSNGNNASNHNNNTIDDEGVRQVIESAFGVGADLYGTVLQVPRDYGHYKEKLQQGYFRRSLELQVPDDASLDDVRLNSLKNRAVGLAYKILSCDECRRLYDDYRIMTLNPAEVHIEEYPEEVVDAAESEELDECKYNSANDGNDIDVSNDRLKSADEELIEEAFGASCNLYRDILRISTNASEEEIREAYCLRAMFFHHNRQQAAQVSANEAAHISLRFRAVTIAYTILSNKKLREMYDEFGIVDTSGEYDLENLSKKSRFEPKRDSNGLPQNNHDSMQDISNETVLVLNAAFGVNADLYETILRIPKNSSKRDIHEGYLRRAMFFHPSRQANRKLSKKQAEKASLCFRAVTIAYQTLWNDSLKEVYDKTGRICRMHKPKADQKSDPNKLKELFVNDEKPDPNLTVEDADDQSKETIPIVSREEPIIAQSMSVEDVLKDPSKVVEFLNFYKRSFEAFVENSVDEANDAVQLFIDDVGDLLAGDVDDYSVNTESVGSLESLDEFDLDDDQVSR